MTAESNTENASRAPARGVLSYPAFFRGMGRGGWQGTRVVHGLKLATLLYEKIIIPIPRSQLDQDISLHSRHFAYDPDLARDAWPSLFDAPMINWYELYERSVSLLLADYTDARYNISLRGAVLLSTILDAGQKAQDDWYKQLFNSGDFMSLSYLSVMFWSQLVEDKQATAVIETDDLVEAGWAKTDLSRSLLSIAPKFRALETLGIPSVEWVPWREIFQLRKASEIKAFREVAGASTQRASDLDLARYTVESLWSIFGKKRSSLGRTVLKSILSNIPLPLPVNPISILLSTYEIARELRKESSEQWLSFWFDVKERAQPPSTGDCVDELTPIDTAYLGSNNQPVQEGYHWYSNCPDDPYKTVRNLLPKDIYDQIRNDTRRRCGAITGTGQRCKRRAGWGTDHPGIGRCKSHGSTDRILRDF